MSEDGLNYRIYRGDSLPIRLRYSAAMKAVQLAGFKVAIAFKYASGHYLMESPEQITLTDTGLILGTVPGSETAKWPVGNNTAMQVRITDTSGSELSIAGSVMVRRSPIEEAKING